MKLTHELISVPEVTMKRDKQFKIKKDEELYVKYARADDVITHILCKKNNVESNKMWILWSVEEDGTLVKVAQGSNPLKLEDKIDYIKAVKDRQST